MFLSSHLDIVLFTFGESELCYKIHRGKKSYAWILGQFTWLASLVPFWLQISHWVLRGAVWLGIPLRLGFLYVLKGLSCSCSNQQCNLGAGCVHSGKKTGCNFSGFLSVSGTSAKIWSPASGNTLPEGCNQTGASLQESNMKAKWLKKNSLWKRLRKASFALEKK